MRILRIGITNLNSLRGTQTIDFTAKPLADNQLYAIVGATGAGKTTILDAITLALYGQTERNKDEKDRKDGRGSIMSYGEGECRAELEYETATGRYRNVWHRQRAHRKPEKDLTPSRREINKWNPQTAAWDLLATKKKQVEERTVAAVGLDYERFVRSVMLTQGDFARFLKSKPGEKAAILEKITGTEIYKDLSMAAFLRHKQAREAHEKAIEALSVAPPLAPEVRAGLVAKLATLQQQSQEALAKRKALQTQLNAYEKLLLARKEAQTAEVEHQEQEKRWATLKPDRDRLALNDQLAPLREALMTAKNLQEAIATLTTQKTTIGETLQSLRKKQAVLTEAKDKVLAKRKAFDEKLPGRETKFSQAAVLETAITKLDRDQLGERKAQDAVRTDIHTVAQRRAKLAGELAQFEQLLGGRSAAEVETELQELENRVPTREKTLRKLEQKIKHGALSGRIADGEKELQQLQPQLAAANQALAVTQAAVKAAEQAVDAATILLNGLRVSAGLHEHKMDLAPGEACPICGATEHPALKTYQPIEPSRILEQEQAVNRFKNELLGVSEKADQQGVVIVELQRKLDVVNTRLQELREQQQALGILEAIAPLPELTEQQRSLQTQQANDRKLLVTLQQLRQQLPKLSELQAALQAAEQRHKELTTVAQQQMENLEKRAGIIQAKRTEKEHLIGQHTVEECRRMTREKEVVLRQQLEAATAAERAESDLLAATTERAKVIEEQLRARTQEQKEVGNKLAPALAQLGLAEPAARAQLLPPETAEALRKTFGEQQQEMAAAKALLERRVRTLQQAEQAVSSLLPEAELRQVVDAQDHASREVNRDIGGLTQQLKQDDERLEQLAAQRAGLINLKQEADRWARLNDLIGSADGKKFRSYAQAITLQQLIEVGNDHLRQINPRYRMAYEPPVAGGPEKLEMVIIDQYQNDNRRTIYTLSGGESFLISLALALGLSDLASGRSLIQSLFIDEGFGTLDGKTLDQAMTTLEQLQAQGKTIGLISHVPQLRERIHCQIQLEPVGDGFSRIEIVDA